MLRRLLPSSHAPRVERPTPRHRTGAALAGLALALGVGALAAPALAEDGSSTGPSAGVAGSSGQGAPGSARRAAKVTPGDFTGYGFDQCLAPSQSAMSTWWRQSPFSAVGIYISGKSRACRSQPNLTPTWISTQLSTGWRLLPITLGPQASCQPRFPRYDDDPTINPDPGKKGRYGKARAMARAEASNAVSVADGLGIGAGSTLWYDLEGFDTSNTRCRESALWFLSQWTRRVHSLGYVSGVYSSAGAGLNALDDARVNRPGVFTMPDRIWLARWDGVANTSTSYLREDGWHPGGRVKQYQGGHNETWGGVTINIDRDFLDLGKGSRASAEEHCGGVRVSWPDYARIHPPSNGEVSDPKLVSALKCLLTERGSYRDGLGGRWNAGLTQATRAWQEQHSLKRRRAWNRNAWMTLHASGGQPTLKRGSTGPGVRRLQRALNSAAAGSVTVTGVLGAPTESALRAWQQRVGLPSTGVLNPASWTALRNGRR